MIRNLYVYHNKTKEYLGCLGEAQIDPLESQKQGKEVLVIPPNCTLSVPVEFNKKKHENIVYNEQKSSWEKVKDYRGAVGYDKDTGKVISIIEFGELPFNFTYEKPVDFQEQKIKKFNDLNVAYNNAQRESVKYGEVEGNVDLRVKIQDLIEHAGTLDYITLELDNGKTVVLTIRQAKSAVKFYSVRNLLLPIKKNEIAAAIRSTRDIKGLSSISFNFDISEETKKVARMSVENINNYIAERIK